MTEDNRKLFGILTTIIAWTNPLVMLAFALIWSVLSVEDLTGIRAFLHAGSNEHRVNLFVFLPVGSLLYYAWLRGQIRLFTKRRPQFSPGRFLKSKLIGSVPACSVGALNLLVFLFGMEGNVFAFAFLVPLLGVGIVSIVIWIVQTVRAFLGHYDAPESSSVRESEDLPEQATV